MQRFFAEPHGVFRQKLRSFVMAEQEHPVLCGGASFGILIFRVYTGIVDFRQENARGFLGRKGGVKKRTVQPGPQAAAFPCDRTICVVIGQRFQGAFAEQQKAVILPVQDKPFNRMIPIGSEKDSIKAG